MKAVLLAAVLGLVAVPAHAQQTTDPRIAGPMIAAMQAEIALRDAAIRAMQEDATKRDAQWAEYSKSLWEKPKEEVK
jgi:hypothetical protein